MRSSEEGHKGMRALEPGERQRPASSRQVPKARAAASRSPNPVSRRTAAVLSHVKKSSDREGATVVEAVSYCSDAIAGGAVEAAADRALKYATYNRWRQVVDDRSGRHCMKLARRARDILNSGSITEDISMLAAVIFGALDFSIVIHLFAHDLAVSIPLTGLIEKSTAAARGLQITGIYSCVTNGRDLSRCACFIDVVEVEGKSRARQLILAGAHDWIELQGLTLG